MKIALILLCLVLFNCSFAVLILQSTPSVAIVSPKGANTIYSAYYNVHEHDIAGPGVEWITSSKTGSPTVYQSLFYANCIGNANLTIAAASSFSAYLDGAYIGNGSNHSHAYTFPIKISCGNHNFTVVVYSVAGVNQGLTFAINQDQSACFNCQPTGFWNENSCSCSCINNQLSTGCQCTSPKVWKDYPICGCGCPSTILKPLPATAAAEAEAHARLPPILFCLPPRYYSQETCSCVCHFQYCPPRYYFNEQACSCFAILT